jgi:hypothetical protein
METDCSGLQIFRRRTTTRPDCLAEVVGFELRNVAANYPFERSHRFAGIQTNSGPRDYSRLSCGIGDTQLGPRAKILAGVLAPALEVALDRAAGGVEGK